MEAFPGAQAGSYFPAEEGCGGVVSGMFFARRENQGLTATSMSGCNQR